MARRMEALSGSAVRLVCVSSHELIASIHPFPSWYAKSEVLDATVPSEAGLLLLEALWVGWDPGVHDVDL